MLQLKKGLLRKKKKDDAKEAEEDAEEGEEGGEGPAKKKKKKNSKYKYLIYQFLNREKENQRRKRIGQFIH